MVSNPFSLPQFIIIVLSLLNNWIYIIALPSKFNARFQTGGQENTIRDVILELLSLLYNDLNSSNKVKWKRHYTRFSITAEAGSHNYPFHYWNTSHSYTGRIPAADTSAIHVVIAAAITAALQLKCPWKQIKLLVMKQNFEKCIFKGKWKVKKKKK